MYCKPYYHDVETKKISNKDYYCAINNFIIYMNSTLTGLITELLVDEYF